MPGTRNTVMLVVSILAVAAGGVAALAGARPVADLVWAGATALVAVQLVVDIVADLLRRRAGVDVIALLAMVGALALGQYLAGAVIAVMLTGGQALEAHAAGRARRELTALLEGAPRVAHRLLDDRVETVEVDAVDRGELLLVRSGEAVPVDAVVVDGIALFDESALTGETRPVPRREHARVASGAVNAGGPVRVRAVSTAADSTYAGIVRLVRQAADARTPFTRIADRYALAFVPVTLVVAAGAWIASGDPVRALAVLVVATPCPLILAAPVALVSGVSVAARRGIIVKGASALEQLAEATSVVFDKTGTLTAGAPRVAEVVAVPGTDRDEVLRLAGSVEQASSHVFADAIIDAARDRGLRLTFPAEVVEDPGVGIAGQVDGGRVRLGSVAWVADGTAVPAAVEAAQRRARLEGSSTVLVSVDDVLQGALLLDDPLRPESARVVRSLRAAGVRHVGMLTGDDRAVAEVVASALGLDNVQSGLSPSDKIVAIQDGRDGGGGLTVMVGDGVNDAPALAGADLGVAMGARGATASSEAADIVITVDRLDRLTEGVAIARWSRHIATQSIVIGMGLSLVAMAFAAAGTIAPLTGAVLQEVIDVAVILNALRALRLPGAGRVTAVDRRFSALFRSEHRTLLAGVDDVKAVADRLEWTSADDARRDLDDIRRFLTDRLLPHEQTEERQLYPRLTSISDGRDPTEPLIGAHREIERIVALFERLVTNQPADGPGPGDRLELRRLLYGLHAILRLHFAQEEELYLVLDDGAVGPGSELAADGRHAVSD
jgi:heavy metal translocating P-type ATPase